MRHYLKIWLLLSLLAINQDTIFGLDGISSGTESNIEFLLGDQPGFSHDQYYEYAMQSQPNLGVYTMFADKFPSSGNTPIALVNGTVLFGDVCSSNSKLKQIVANYTSTIPVTCNGMVSTVSPFTMETIIGGENVNLTIEKVFARSVQLNGNQIFVGSGMIMEPTECKGSMMVRVAINLANSQYACVTTGLTGQSTLFNLILVSAPCESYCWLSAGNITLASPVNVLGLVASTPIPLTSAKREIVEKRQLLAY